VKLDSIAFLAALPIAASLLAAQTGARGDATDPDTGEAGLDPAPIERTDCDASATLMAVGDIQLGRTIWAAMVESRDFAFPLAGLAERLREADVAVGNLEAQIFASCPILRRGMRLCAGTRAVEPLVDAGIDVVSVANNHALDFGPGALESSTRTLRANGIRVAGLGRAPIVDTPAGTRFAFLAYSPVNELVPLKRIVGEIRGARARGADVVVALVHWGEEYAARPSRSQVDLARFLEREGVDVVIGSHPHVVQPLERSGDAAIAYSLGNCVFDQMWSEETSRGAVASFAFCGGALESAEILPIRLDPPGVPRFAEDGREIRTEDRRD